MQQSINSLYKPQAYFTHNATSLLTAQLEIQVLCKGQLIIARSRDEEQVTQDW